MPSIDYLPKDEDNLVTWLNNFGLKLTTVYNTTFALTPAQVTAVQQDVAMAVYLISQYAEPLKTGLKDRIAYKDLIINGRIGQVGGAVPGGTIAIGAIPAFVVAPGVLARIRALVKQLKAHAQYNAVIGADLGVIGATSTVNVATAKPRCSIFAKPGVQVVITWTKGRFEGVLIEGQRGAETTWTQVDKDGRSPYTDLRPNAVANTPETRRYRLWYLLDDKVVGLPSDVLTVSTIA